MNFLSKIKTHSIKNLFSGDWLKAMELEDQWYTKVYVHLHMYLFLV